MSFSAPEVLENKAEKCSDIFSLGLIICSILKTEFDKSCYQNKIFNVSDIYEYKKEIKNI